MDERLLKERMRDARVKGNFTQKDMAERLGISLRAYNSLESGDTRIFNGNFLKIADITDNTVEEMVLGYVPDPEASRKLTEAEHSYNEKLLRTEVEYRDRITHLEKLLEEKDRIIDDLKVVLERKEGIITYLERQLDERQG